MGALVVAAVGLSCRSPAHPVHTAPPAPAPTDPASALAAGFLAAAAQHDVARARALFDLDTHVYTELPVMGLAVYTELEATGRSSISLEHALSQALGANRQETERIALEDMFQYLNEARCRPSTDRWKAHVVPKPPAEGQIGGWFTSITALESVGLACERPEAVVPRNAEVAVVQKLVGLAIVTRRGIGIRVADLLFDDRGQLYTYLAASLERDPEEEARKARAAAVREKAEQERERAERERAPIVEYLERSPAPDAGALGPGPAARPKHTTRDGCDFDGDGQTDFVVVARTAEGGHAPFVFSGKDRPWKAPPTTPLSVAAPPKAELDASCAGDVNGDGFDDVLVSAISLTPAVRALQIHLGSKTGVSREPVSRITPFAGSSSSFVSRARGVGDVNGDGRDDLLVVDGGTDHVLLYLGGPTGVDAKPTLLIVGPKDAQFGRAFVGAGDLDGDGRGELAILAGRRQRAYLFRGGPHGLAPQIYQEIQLPYPLLDGSMTFGDVDGDGLGEIVISCGQQMLGEGTGGILLVLRQTAGRFVESAEQLSPGPSAAYGNFGETLAYVGDLDGDGLGDVAVGAPRAPPDWRGGIYIFFGHKPAVPRTALKLEGTGAANSLFGYGLIASGDFDRDRHRDLVVQDLAATYLWRGKKRTLVPLMAR